MSNGTGTKYDFTKSHVSQNHMKKIILNLKSQPEAVRRHILHVSTIVCAIILILLWMYSLGNNISNPDTQAKVGNELKPFSALKANIMDGYQSLSDSE